MTTHLFQKTSLHCLLKNYFFFEKSFTVSNQGIQLNNNTLNKVTSVNNIDKNADYNAYKDIYLTATRW